MYGLCDCNNFYVSCERVFNPSLNGKPVVVLSNNDGCVISRSNEAKAIGIKMGQPYYQIYELEKRGILHVYSSNFTLYGDMSRRVMNLLKENTPNIEIYSIDEAFINLCNIPEDSLKNLGQNLVKKIYQYTGIPVSIGIAPTKTLAKIASKLCKKYPKLNGSCLMNKQEDINKVLTKYPVEEVWGIGHRITKLLTDYGIKTAKEFSNLSPYWVKQKMTIIGLKTWKELNGEACIAFEDTPNKKQQICVSRSFSKGIATFEELHSAIANFAAMCSEKLRKQNCICKQISVFISTNKYNQDSQQYFSNLIVNLEDPTDSSLEIIKHSVFILKKIFKEGYYYKKAGVILIDIIPKSGFQYSLFNKFDISKNTKLMQTIDTLNKTYGNNTLVTASQGFNGISMNRNHLSQKFTTNWDELLSVK